MKPETLLMIGIGAAGLLWYMDKQQKAANTQDCGGGLFVPQGATCPTMQAQPAMAPVLPAYQAPASPTPLPGDDSVPVVQVQRFITPRGHNTGGTLVQPTGIAQRDTRTLDTPVGSMAGIPMYGGWK